MQQSSLFIAIEGLDGSGKTTIARQLAYFMQSVFNENVKLTFEPHDPSCGGLFIRQVLEKKIRDFSHETLMLAFAANRLDHCDREINEWLSTNDDAIIICDRYYLSSLVYQSNEDFSFEHVMDLNSGARKPDLTIFMNVSNEVCYQRMKIRNKPKELFEQNLSQTREKYLKAIDFLKDARNENIILIDASGNMNDVLHKTVKTISKFSDEKRAKQLSQIESYDIPSPKVFTLEQQGAEALEQLVLKVKSSYKDKYQSEDKTDRLLNKVVREKFDDLSLNDKGALFLDYLRMLGYVLATKYPWTHLDAYELEFTLPGGMLQRGTALLVNENQRYDVILESVSNLQKMSDFMFVFSPGPAELVTKYYEREIIQSQDKSESLFPSTQLITESKLIEVVFNKSKNIFL